MVLEVVEQNEFKKSISAGMSISLGTFAYLIVLQKTNNMFVSAIMFYMGLCIILSHQLSLFTGQILSLKVKDYTKQYYTNSNISNKEYILTLTKTWIGNLIGSVITTVLLFQILHPNVRQLVINKISLSPLQMIIGGFFCNVCVCLAVDNYKTNKNYLVSGFFIICFIMCGFNHIVADFSHYTLAMCQGNNC